LFDIAPFSIPANLQEKFVRETKAMVKRFFGPPQDPACHLEFGNFTDRLNQLKEVLRCNPDNALNISNFPP
jgi:hypothetical protein